jgi:hypothetical protein
MVICGCSDELITAGKSSECDSQEEFNTYQDDRVIGPSSVAYKLAAEDAER